MCLQHIARFKRPKAYVFLAELPKNNTGKVLKTVLRERIAGLQPGLTPDFRGMPGNAHHRR